MEREARRRRAEAIDRYWDAVLAGAPVDEGLDAGEIPTQLILRLQALANAPGREAAERRVWEHLSDQSKMGMMRRDAVVSSAGSRMGMNGRASPAPWSTA